MRQLDRDWLREKLSEKRGLRAELARHLGIENDKVSKILAGTRQVQASELPKILSFFGEQLTEARKVPVVGYVGGGAEIYPIDDHMKGDGLEHVDAPPGAGRNAVAVVVRGDSMLPKYEDGDVLIYDDHEDPAALINKTCIVQLEDGRLLVKRLRRGVAPGSYTLTSYNASDIEGVKITWAARVAFVIPA